MCLLLLGQFLVLIAFFRFGFTHFQPCVSCGVLIDSCPFTARVRQLLLSYLVFFLQRPWGLEGCACSCEQPSSWGSKPGLSFGLWVREQGEFRQWYHNCFMVQRGVGCAPQDLRSGTGTVLEGMLWEGKDSENLCIPCELVGSECLEPFWFVAGDIVVYLSALGDPVLSVSNMRAADRDVPQVWKGRVPACWGLCKVGKYHPTSMFKHGDFSLYTSAEIADCAKMGQIDYRSKDRMPVKPDSEEICRKWETAILITKSFYLTKYIFWKKCHLRSQ